MALACTYNTLLLSIFFIQSNLNKYKKIIKQSHTQQNHTHKSTHCIIGFVITRNIMLIIFYLCM